MLAYRYRVRHFMLKLRTTGNFILKVSMLGIATGFKIFYLES